MVIVTDMHLQVEQRHVEQVVSLVPLVLTVMIPKILYTLVRQLGMARQLDLEDQRLEHLITIVLIIMKQKSPQRLSPMFHGVALQAVLPQ